MHQTRPLPDTHPEFTVIRRPAFTEYRVEHWRLARDGSGRVVRRTCAWCWVDVCVLALVVGTTFGRFEIPMSRPMLLVSIGLVLTCLVWTRFTQVLYESLLVFPSLGIQLETHRGYPLLPTLSLSTTHRFIPLSALEDVVIHEGLRRWDVRFYLAVLRRRRTGGIQISVAFEDVLPYFPVLKEVYLGVQETFFPSPTRVGEAEKPTNESE